MPRVRRGHPAGRDPCRAAVAETRKTYEAKLAASRRPREREARVKAEAEKLKAEREDLESDVQKRLAFERARIIAAEAKRPKRPSAAKSPRCAARPPNVTPNWPKHRKRRPISCVKAAIWRKSSARLDLTIEKRVAEARRRFASKARSRGRSRAGPETGRDRQGHRRHAAPDGRDASAAPNRARSNCRAKCSNCSSRALLAQAFPTDRIEPVGKGVSGADLPHVVLAPSGQQAGEIIWETEAHQELDRGLARQTAQRPARSPRRNRGALSEALPKGVESFDLVDGVWVAHPRFAVPLALILRQSCWMLRRQKPRPQAGRKPRWRWSMPT